MIMFQNLTFLQKMFVYQLQQLFLVIHNSSLRNYVRLHNKIQPTLITRSELHLPQE